MLEGFHKDITKNHAAFYTYSYNPDISALAKIGLTEDAQKIGFTKPEAEQFAKFILDIRPTYSQICSWINNLGYDKKGSTLNGILLRSTVALPNEHKNTSGIWPEHAAATFIIEDYDFNMQTILVKKLRIIPGVDSTQSAPEQITGRILRRSVGSL